jgi:hypothetical protein
MKTDNTLFHLSNFHTSTEYVRQTIEAGAASYCSHRNAWIFTITATSRKIAGSISDEVTAFFSSPYLSSRTTALGSTQSLTEMSTRNLPEGKGQPAGA